MLPLSVSIGSVLLSGFLVAIIVTATHQSEEMFTHQQQENEPYNFVRSQFLSTRDVSCSNFLIEFLWGGMQYQLEHHLFPTMPKYHYAALSKRLAKWAKESGAGLDYRCDTVPEIMQRNWNTLRTYALESQADSRDVKTYSYKDVPNGVIPIKPFTVSK